MAGVQDMAAGLLVIDHFAQVLGEIDENTSGVARVMSSLRGLAESANVAIVLIHHSVKNVARFGISSSDALRGHSSIIANCDLAALVERQTLDPLGINCKPVACRGPALDPFAARFSYEQKSDGSLELESARFFGEAVESVDIQIEQVVIDVLENDPGITQTALRAAVAQRVSGAGDPAIRSMLARLESDGRVVVKRGKQNAKLYELPGGSGG